MADHERDPDGILSRRIEELESLLASRGQATGKPRGEPQVPILDELVEPGAGTGPGAAETVPAPGRQELDELAARLEQKFSQELDQTVRIIKDNLRQSIVDELQSELGQGANRPQGPRDRD